MGNTPAALWQTDIPAGAFALGPDYCNDSRSVKFVVTTEGRVGIGADATNPRTRLQVGRRLIDDNNFGYDLDALSVFHPIPTSSTALNDPHSILLLARQGTSGQAFAAGASFNLSRYENNGFNSRTRMDISLAHSGFDVTGNTVMSMLSNGNVGFGTTSPVAKLDIVGGADASGANDLKAMSFQWRSGGYRHWLRTRHDGVAGSRQNAFDFYLNNSTASDGSSAPGMGTTLGMSVTATGVEVPTGKLDLGAGQAGREINAGKIAYQLFSTDALDILGAGTTPTNRKIKFYNEGGAVFTGKATFTKGGGSNQITGNEQVQFGFNGTNYQHAIRTRHNSVSAVGNAIDFYTWKFGTDAVAASSPTQHVMTLDGNGNVGIGTTTPAVLLEVGKNSSNTTPTILDVHGHAIFNNDQDSLTTVSINTDVRVGNAALTVGGPTYIGSWTGILAGSVKGDYLKKYNLWVAKGIVSEDFILTAAPAWRDEVFQPGYHLPTLDEVESFIKAHRHLPGIPSEQEVKEKGYSVHEINTAYLEKIEHLMLYSIEQQKKIKALETELEGLTSLRKELELLKEQIRK